MPTYTAGMNEAAEIINYDGVGPSTTSSHNSQHIIYNSAPHVVHGWKRTQNIWTVIELHERRKETKKLTGI